MTWRITFALALVLVVTYKLLPGIYGFLQIDPRLFVSAVKDPGFHLSLRLSVLWALFNSSLVVLSAITLVWVFREGRKHLIFFLFLPWSVPMYLSVLTWRFAIFGLGGESLVSKLHIPNDLVTDPVTAFIWASLVNVWINVPIVSLAISSAVDNVPEELFESASIDGASDSELFLNVYLPYVFPTASGWFLMEFVRFTHSFTVPYLLTEGGPAGTWGMVGYEFVGSTTTLGVYNYEMFAKMRDLDILNSYSTLTFIVVAVIVAVWIFREKTRLVATLLAFLKITFGLNDSSPISVLFFAFLIVISIQPKIAKLGWIFPISSAAWVMFDPLGFDPMMVIFSVWFMSGRITLRRIFRLKFPVFKILGYVFSGFVIFGSVLVISAILSTLSGGVPEPIPRGISLKPFSDLIRDGYVAYVKNSLSLSLPVSVLAPFLAFPVAYHLSRKRSNVLMTFFLALQSIGGIHLLTLIYSAYADLGILDEITWVVPMIMANVVPRIAVSAKGFLDEVDREVEDLAVLDGGRSLAMRIVFRLSLPAILVGAIMGFSAGWNAFLAPLMLLVSEEKYPVSVKLYDYAGDLMGRYPRWDLFGAGTVVNLAVIFAFLIAMRFTHRLVEGSRSTFRWRTRKPLRMRKPPLSPGGLPKGYR